MSADVGLLIFELGELDNIMSAVGITFLAVSSAEIVTSGSDGRHLEICCRSMSADVGLLVCELGELENLVQLAVGILFLTVFSAEI